MPRLIADDGDITLAGGVVTGALAALVFFVLFQVWAWRIDQMNDAPHVVQYRPCVVAQ